MKTSRLLWPMCTLIVLSLACNIAEATPMVDILPTEIQPVAQPPAEFIPTDTKPVAGQAPAPTGLVITQVVVAPASTGTGTITTSVHYTLTEGSDYIVCLLDAGTSENPKNVLDTPVDATDQLRVMGFSFPLIVLGKHTVTCSNQAGTSSLSTDFVVGSTASLPTIQNPGFENGFSPWTELPAALTYGGQSVDENVVARSGSHSRKLFLRYGGSYVIQRVTADPPLPVNAVVTLKMFIKMPEAGSQSNKVFTLELVIGDSAGHTVTVKRDQADALADWTELTLSASSPDFEAAWIEIHAMTNKGDGNYKNFDKVVYVDDFSLEISQP